jgi:hypothetical protein
MEISPYFEDPIKIDRDGIWSYQSIDIVHEETRKYLSDHLVRDLDGSYYVQIRGKRCCVEVEDVPFIVDRIERLESPNGRFLVILNDGTTDAVPLETITIQANHIFYCQVKEGRFPARFSRRACYQLADYIVYDPSTDQSLLVTGGTDSQHIIPLKML